jgi:hypothetical protein
LVEKFMAFSELITSESKLTKSFSQDVISNRKTNILILFRFIITNQTNYYRILNMIRKKNLLVES